MQHTSTWLWDPRIQAMLDYLGIPWKVLPKTVRLSPEELGSCPGDICWLNQTFHIEATCPEKWVVHDLAHWLVCQRDRPEMLQDQNFGHENMKPKQIREDENITSDVNITLLKRLGIPYEKCADEINVNIYEEDFQNKAEPYLQPILAFLQPRS